jgi:hypothetical protein
VGPDTGGIELGGIRNIVQVIAVEAGTENKVVHFEQAVKEKDSAAGTNLTVSNIWEGKRYHFLILMGHLERDYGVEIDPSVKYEYKTDAPTLLAAGFLGDQTIPEGGTILAITMKPLVVDTGFTYAGVTARAALGGTELPAGVDANLVWTITGDGLAMLVDAQTRTGHDSGWGGLTLAEGQNNNTMFDVSAGGGGTKPAVLGGADRNQIVLDLGALEGGTSGSANFNLAYIPFGFGTMEKFTAIDGQAASWIIRNGVNDKKQDGGTTFTLTYDELGKARIPWGTAYNDEGATYNGNGAVVFGWAQGSVDLTRFVPAPSVGATPTTSFFTSQYIGKVKWTPDHSTFQAGVAYSATATLEPAAGFVVSSDLTASHSGAVGGAATVTHEYDLSAYVPVPVNGMFPKKKEGNYAWGNYATWGDYSTDKWEIKAWWYYQKTASNSAANDGEWKGDVTAFAGNTPYAAAILLTAKPDYSFDEGIDFKYPTYDPDGGTGPVRGYYGFDSTLVGTTTANWLWQNAIGHTSPPASYDTARVGYRCQNSGSGTTSIDAGYPSNPSSSGQGDKDRNKERLVLVGFNTQDTVPVPVSPPSGGPEGGVRIAMLGFDTLGIPANVDSGGATFSEALAMIQAAKTAGGYLSLKLNRLTAANMGTDEDPDNSGGKNVAFSTTTSPPSVVIDGGNRVVGYRAAAYGENLFITVGSGVSLTLRNITLRGGPTTTTGVPFVWVEAGGALILEEGAVIRGHTNNGSNGCGVYVAAGGTLIMKGGEIRNNTTNQNGGAVHVASDGSFTMQGGTISGNTATGGNGGGVYVAPGGAFTMQGGTISGNTATGGNGGGVYVAGPAGGVPGGMFVKSNGAIYGAGAGNTNTATGSGSAVYVQGGRYRNDTVMGFLDSGKSINEGGWDYPVIKHTYYRTVGTDGTLAAGQVDWYAFTAPGGGAPLSVEKISGDDVKVSAYRAYGAPIPLDAAPPAFAAGEKVYVKVEGNTPSSSGNYSIRQGPLLLISNSNPGTEQANTGTITVVGQVDWYFFTAGTPGTYSVMWEDKSEKAGTSTHYTGGDVEVSAYGYDATLIFGPQDMGYNGGGVPIDLVAGETIYVKAVGQSTSTIGGTYGIRYYPVPYRGALP